MRDAWLGIQRTNSGRFKKGHKHTEETKQKMSEAHVGHKRAEGAGRPSQSIEVFDLKEDTTTTYDSIREAARALNIRQTRISEFFIRNQLKPYKGRYIFSKVGPSQ